MITVASGRCMPQNDTWIRQNIDHFFHAICLQYQTQANRQLDGETDGQTENNTH